MYSTTSPHVDPSASSHHTSTSPSRDSELPTLGAGQREFPSLLPYSVEELMAGIGIRSAYLLDLDELEALSPTAKLCGFDINPRLFPAPEWLPPRITLSQLDILDASAISSHHVGTYDVVIARLLMTVFRDGDPAPFLKTATRMLRPGGTLIWVDCRSLSEEYGAYTTLESRKMAAAVKTMGYLKAYYKHLDMVPE